MRFEQRVRERAYFLWQDAGRADDCADEVLASRLRD